jgi:hypothetical protein
MRLTTEPFEVFSMETAGAVPAGPVSSSAGPFTLGAIAQRARQLLTDAVFNGSLVARFVSGRIWNEDHLALEILFHRVPARRPTGLDALSESARLRKLRSLAIQHQRELDPIRQQIVRPLFGNPSNFQIAPATGCMVQDLRAEVRKLGAQSVTKEGRTFTKRVDRLSPRRAATVDSIVLHHMAYNIGNDVKSYLRVGAHYIVTADGQVAQLYPDLDFLNAANGFNHRSISIEFAGNFPTERYHWWAGRDNSVPPKRLHPDRCYLTPAQIRAGRCLLATLKARHPGIKYLYAHRQSSKDREADPGPDVWFQVGQWALATLALDDARPRLSVGDGQPIPASWRVARPSALRRP